VIDVKRRSWKVWVAGIALAQLLVVGVDVALRWPQQPSEAEREAAKIKLRMTQEQVVVALGFEGPTFVYLAPPVWQRYDDESRLILAYDSFSGRVISVDAFLPPPIHPLTLLRRTAARVLPFLGE
jgi:hypothetical protein